MTDEQAKREHEYLRRNLLHAKVVGVQADIDAAIDRLIHLQTPAPRWLIKLLDRAHSKAYDVSKEIWRHRDEVRP